MVYYFSSSLGNDSNSGTSPTYPFQSETKFNAIKTSLVAGDSILFKCGDVFNWLVKPTVSGASGNFITLSSYGTGNLPQFSGKIAVTTWTNIGGNLWTATNPISSNVRNLFIGGVPQTLGRFPKFNTTDGGYKTFTAHSGTASITDASLPDSPSYVGIECVVRNNAWLFNRRKVYSQAGGVITFTSALGYTPTDNGGYFFQNDPSFCTVDGEWAYNSTTRVFTLYSTTDPNTLTVETTALDKLLDISYTNFIKVEYIEFVGSSTDSIYIDNSDSAYIRNCTINYSGENAVTVRNSNNNVFSANTINTTNASGYYQVINYNCNGLSMVGNNFSNIAIQAGRERDGVNPSGAKLYGNSQLFQYNNFANLGYIGVSFRGEGVDIINNTADNYGMVYEDGGAIYTWNGDEVTANTVTSYVRYNIVGNASPYGHYGSPVSVPTFHGIYMDDATQNVQILNNTTSNNTEAGIYLHNADNITVQNNISFNNATQIRFYHDSLEPTHHITGCTITNNIFVCKDATQILIDVNSLDTDVVTANTFNNNNYSAPYSNTSVVKLWINGGAYSGFHNIAYWKTTFGLDAASTIEPISLTTENANEYLVLITNPTAAVTSNDLSAVYVDASGAAVSSPVSLGPYAAKILFKTGSLPFALPKYDVSKMVITPFVSKDEKVYTFKPIDPTSYLTCVRAGATATYFDYNGLLKVAPANAVVIDYSNGCAEIIVEDTARTNKFPKSNDFTYWFKGNGGTGTAPVVTPNYSVSPDGTTNASRLQCNLNGGVTSSDQSNLYRALATALGNSSMGVWVKSNTGVPQDVYLRIANSKGIVVFTVPTVWTRIKIENSTIADTLYIGIRGGYTTTDALDISIYEFQTEPNLLLGSNIPTNGAEAVRNPDVITIATLPGTAKIYEKIAGVVNPEITTIPNPYQLPAGRINGVYMI